jgi:hypothetical protein
VNTGLVIKMCAGECGDLVSIVEVIQAYVTDELQMLFDGFARWKRGKVFFRHAETDIALLKHKQFLVCVSQTVVFARKVCRATSRASGAAGSTSSAASATHARRPDEQFREAQAPSAGRGSGGCRGRLR